MTGISRRTFLKTGLAAAATEPFIMLYAQDRKPVLPAPIIQMQLVGELTTLAAGVVQNHALEPELSKKILGDVTEIMRQADNGLPLNPIEVAISGVKAGSAPNKLDDYTFVISPRDGTIAAFKATAEQVAEQGYASTQAGLFRSATDAQSSPDADKRTYRMAALAMAHRIYEVEKAPEMQQWLQTLPVSKRPATPPGQRAI